LYGQGQQRLHLTSLAARIGALLQVIDRDFPSVRLSCDGPTSFAEGRVVWASINRNI